jgi:hypothetical protein
MQDTVVRWWAVKDCEVLTRAEGILAKLASMNRISSDTRRPVCAEVGSNSPVAPSAFARTVTSPACRTRSTKASEPGLFGSGAALVSVVGLVQG